MYVKKTEALIEHLNDKMSNGKIRVTTFINGENKNHFLKDCIRQEIHEAAMAKHIIDLYYSIVSNQPAFFNKGPNEIKRIIMDKVRL